MRWTLLIDPAGRPGHENMTIDYGLLRAARDGAAFLRLYRWNPPCLSFGRNEPARQRYDMEAIRALKLNTVRRPTGGRAVWHHAELTYAVAAPCSVFGSLRSTYVAIHEMLAQALGRLGVSTSLAPSRPSHQRHPAPSAGACFASPAGGEVVVGDRKLVGSAQVREGSAFLQHGSLLLEDGQDMVTRLTRGTAPRAVATSLAEVLSRSVAFEEVTDVIATQAQESWSGCWHETRDSPPVDGIDMFESWDWTWRL